MTRLISDTVDPAVQSGGFGKVVELKAHHSLTDYEKLVLLTQHFIASPHYKFPAHVFNGHQRHFQPSWLAKYQGLAHSKVDDKG